MSKQLTFLALAKKVLTEAKRPLAPSEIWKIALSKGYQSQLSSEGIGCREIAFVRP